MDIKSIITVILFFLTTSLGVLIAYDIKKSGKLFGKEPATNNWQWNDQWDSSPKSLPIDQPIPATPSTPDVQIVANSYAEALQKSGELGKPVLVFFTADSCQWCKKMKSEAMVDPNVQAVLKHYILVYEDTDKSREAANRFGATSLPSFVITNSKQDKLKMDVGYKSANDFSVWLSDASLFSQPKQAAPQTPPTQPKKEPKRRFRDRRSPQPQNPGT